MRALAVEPSPLLLLLLLLLLVLLPVAARCVLRPALQAALLRGDSLCGEMALALQRGAFFA